MAYDFLKGDYYNVLDERKYCSNEESETYLENIKNGEPLPEDVHYTTTSEGKKCFYRYPQLNNDELISCILLNQAKSLNSIRRCIEFCTGIVAISLLITIIASCSIMMK